MIITIEKNIVCTDASACAEEIRQAVEQQHPPTTPQSYHIDIDHTPNLHKIYLCFYDNAGEVCYLDQTTKQEVKIKNQDTTAKKKAVNVKTKSEYETTINEKLLVSSTVKEFTP